MLTFHSFLQTVFQSIHSLFKTVTKKIYRTTAVLTTGVVVMAAVTFTSNDFGGGGENVLAAYTQTNEWQSVEAALFTEAKVQAVFTDSVSRKGGQLLVGSLLVQETNDKIANQSAMLQEIRRNQEEVRLAAGERTLNGAQDALKQTTDAGKAQAVIDYSEEDYQLLLRIVEAEAGICDEKGRILVANVIMNRVQDGEFPDSVKGVVYQPSQFSPVSDGRLGRVTVTEETVEAVDRALAGEDYSEGALFFMNRDRSQSRNVSWFDQNLTYLFHHDDHDFYK